MDKEATLYDLLGGKPTLEKVHKIFYDKIYAHSWMKQFFQNVDQETIENQQTDFMAQAMGGPARFSGNRPVPAHKHIHITEELFDVPHQILKESLAQAGVSPELAERWLKIDSAFRAALVKKSAAECEKRYFTDEILDFPNPHAKKKAA